MVRRVYLEHNDPHIIYINNLKSKEYRYNIQKECVIDI